ncbi:PAAR domain-containing protein [Chitinophaga vietnamensis]|uniref:PAAR domain-containing protein n=1 Tax=Chitinophaga vietnamensis TaxID=2593957 RepID=UPI00117787CD|nr:PAAR domain-containing protein [Chitinophaga vietnamensis]
MPFAARVNDNHVCPASTGTVAHVGGPILSPGVPTVLIGGQPAATANSLCTCTGATDSITTGSQTVLIGGLQAARVNDPTAHGGSIMTGCETVIIGG